MLKNFQGLKVRHCSSIFVIAVVKSWSFIRAACTQTWSLAPDDEPAQAVGSVAGAGEGVQVVPPAGGSLQGFRAAKGLLHPPERLHPAASAPPHALQADPGASVQTLPSDSRGLQGLQRYSTQASVCACTFSCPGCSRTVALIILRVWLFLQLLWQTCLKWWTSSREV